MDRNFVLFMIQWARELDALFIYKIVSRYWLFVHKYTLRFVWTTSLKKELKGIINKLDFRRKSDVVQSPKYAYEKGHGEINFKGLIDSP